MLRLTVLCPVLALAALAVAEQLEPVEECPRPARSEVVVKALRFSDSRSYAFTVTNNGTRPIRIFAIGSVGTAGPFIEDTYNSIPINMGSPNGWKGRHLGSTDPRLPNSHAETLIRYYWDSEDEESWIQPRRSLSGFVVQLPTPHETEIISRRLNESWGLSGEPLKDPPLAERLPPQPDLMRVPFKVLGVAGKCQSAIGTVVPDRVDARAN